MMQKPCTPALHWKKRTALKAKTRLAPEAHPLRPPLGSCLLYADSLRGATVPPWRTAQGKTTTGTPRQPNPPLPSF